MWRWQEAREWCDRMEGLTGGPIKNSSPTAHPHHSIAQLYLFPVGNRSAWYEIEEIVLVQATFNQKCYIVRQGAEQEIPSAPTAPHSKREEAGKTQIP